MGPTWQQPVPGYSPPPPAPVQDTPAPPPPRSTTPRVMIAALIAGVFIAGAAGVFAGTRMAGTPAQSSSAPTTTQAPEPTADEVRAQTIDLCTRFAAGYAALPTPQNTAADVVPAANYIADAVNDNRSADPEVRSAVIASLRLFRDHAAALSREPVKGAVQPPTTWTAATANATDDRVWAACQGYKG